MKFFLLVLSFLFVVSKSQSQKQPEINFEALIEELFQLYEQDMQYSEIYENLLQYYTSPLSLNDATSEQLSSLIMLSPQQIQNFLDYRASQGKIVSIYELQIIEGFDSQLIQSLLPFVTVAQSQKAKPLLRRIVEEKNTFFLFRFERFLEEKKGFDTQSSNPYFGSPDYVYGRLQIRRQNDFSIGFTFEKDAGEPIAFHKKQRGFDYYSGHILLENVGKIRQIIFGDFQLQVGQSLVLGSGFTIGKGAESVNTIKRNTLGILPHTSVLEQNFFRGSALSIDFGKINATIFGSLQHQDATIIEADSLANMYEKSINAIKISGLHRTRTEQESKNTTLESNVGLSAVYKPIRKFYVGITALQTFFNQRIQPQATAYNQHFFRGKRNFVGSLFFKYHWRSFHFFGETAVSESGGKGMVMGVISSVSQYLDWVVSIRQYDKNFHSFYAKGFGENSQNRNEKGIYWGVKYYPFSNFKIAAYFDKFFFPWLKYQVNAPSQGHEWLTRISYSVNEHTQVYFQYKSENKQISTAKENLSVLVDRIKRNYILNIDYEIGNFLTLKSRIQTSTLKEGNGFSKGFVIVQDISWVYKKWKMSARFAVFETDNFDNAQFLYERDVLYAFNFKPYHGQGIRQYVLLQYQLNSNVDLWLRWSQFNLLDTETIGAGNDEIQGNRSNEIKMMIRIRK